MTALRVWDPETGAELAVLHGHEDAVQGAAWSPDGERIATASRDRTAPGSGTRAPTSTRWSPRRKPGSRAS